MWICTSNSFLSIVDKSNDPTCLMVRARVKGHIEAMFPDAKVSRTPGNDYLFRADIKRKDVADALVKYVAELDYPNFKDSVKNDHLHRSFGRIWHVMADMQEIAPYSRQRRARQPALPFSRRDATI